MSYIIISNNNSVILANHENTNNCSISVLDELIVGKVKGDSMFATQTILDATDNDEVWGNDRNTYANATHLHLEEISQIDLSMCIDTPVWHLLRNKILVAIFHTESNNVYWKNLEDHIKCEHENSLFGNLQ